MRSRIALGVIVSAGVLAYTVWPVADPTPQTPLSSPSASSGVIAQVNLPEALSQNAQIGQRAYESNCTACHGTNAAGQMGVAPPLVHKIYEPSHHGDDSFYRAAANGVRAHHWRFGNMPPVDGIARADVTLIIAYIRELQRANGIH